MASNLPAILENVLLMVRKASATLDAVDVLRGGFLLTACAVRSSCPDKFMVVMPLLTVTSQILAVNSILVFRSRFISYGPRAMSQPENGSTAKPRTTSAGLLDKLEAWNVPHNYFKHFYIVSVVSSVTWGIQLAVRGPLFRVVASTLTSARLSEPSMSFNQIALCWTLLAFQGVRRLYECITLDKPSSSRMWVGHWLFGLAYYTSMGIAVWIEGTCKDSDLMNSYFPGLILFSLQPPSYRPISPWVTPGSPPLL